MNSRTSASVIKAESRRGQDQTGQEAAPSPAFLRSMAYCMIKLYKHDRAEALFRKYLDRYPRAKDRQKIRSTLRSIELVAKTKLVVNTTPSGAALYIDAEAAGRVGITPFSGTVEPGRHTLILRRHGYQDAVHRISVAGGQTHSAVIPLLVPVLVKSLPASATVHVGGPDTRAVGKTPVAIGLAPGLHQLYVKAAGYLVFGQQVTVQPGSNIVITARLPLGLQVDSRPAGAAIELDGQPQGKPTPTLLSVAPGKHQVLLKLKGYGPFVKDLDVRAGAANRIDAKLTGGGLLSMRTVPAGAGVRVGGVALGQTPLTKIDVPLGTHRLTIQHPDRQPFEESLDFGTTEHVDGEVRLGHKTWPIWVAVAVAGASLAAGIGTSIGALKQRDDARNTKYYTHNLTTGQYDLRGTGYCLGLGKPVTPDGRDTTLYRDDKGSSAIVDPCNPSTEYAAYATLSLAGIAAAFAVIYYYVFTQPSKTIKHLRRADLDRGLVAYPARL
jgi:hypothetical protein